jgi:fatty-acyl-CoA synthase
VLNAINTRLDAAAIAAILAHAEAKVFIAHASLLNTAVAALQRLERRPVVVVIGGSDQDRKALAAFDYDAFLEASDPLDWRPPADEWDALALNYTSGTTGAPKGAVYSHRGAYLNALGNVVTFGLRPDSVYLWVLPMFHCNGWTIPGR